MWLAFAAVGLALGLGGCATPGPAHLYVAPAQRPAVIVDVALEGGGVGAGVRVDVPSYVRPGERLVGLAYDPFTDHLFLRLAPGNRIRVVDRPARRIKRQFAAEGVSAAGDGDLAIRSRDRHLFLGHPTDAAVIETTLSGKFVRTIALEAGGPPPAGVAYDQARDELLVLGGGDLAHVRRFDLEGRRLGGVALDRDVELTALAFDSAAREFYAPLRGGRAIGVFSETGQLQREVPLAEIAPAGVRGLDVGQRSALRLF
ncbi:MAG TPA: hypothetical protein VGD81_05185 [Opitutaceae bacterium]